MESVPDTDQDNIKYTNFIIRCLKESWRTLDENSPLILSSFIVSFIFALLRDAQGYNTNLAIYYTLEYLILIPIYFSIFFKGISLSLYNGITDQWKKFYTSAFLYMILYIFLIIIVISIALALLNWADSMREGSTLPSIIRLIVAPTGLSILILSYIGLGQWGMKSVAIAAKDSDTSMETSGSRLDGRWGHLFLMYIIYGICALPITFAILILANYFDFSYTLQNEVIKIPVLNMQIHGLAIFFAEVYKEKCRDISIQERYWAPKPNRILR